MATTKALLGVAFGGLGLLTLGKILAGKPPADLVEQEPVLTARGGAKTVRLQVEFNTVTAPIVPIVPDPDGRISLSLAWTLRGGASMRRDASRPTGNPNVPYRQLGLWVAWDNQVVFEGVPVVVKPGRVVRFSVRNLQVVLPQDGQDHRVVWSVRNEQDQHILAWNARVLAA